MTKAKIEMLKCGHTEEQKEYCERDGCVTDIEKQRAMKIKKAK